MPNHETMHVLNKTYTRESHDISYEQKQLANDRLAGKIVTRSYSVNGNRVYLPRVSL